MTIPQASVTEGLHFEENRRVLSHCSVNAGKTMVGILDDMSECDCFRHEPAGDLSRRDAAAP